MRPCSGAKCTSNKIKLYTTHIIILPITLVGAQSHVSGGGGEEGGGGIGGKDEKIEDEETAGESVGDDFRVAEGAGARCALDGVDGVDGVDGALWDEGGGAMSCARIMRLKFFCALL